MLALPDIDALVALLYEAALDSSRWTEFLVSLCARLHSHTGLIWANDFNSNSIDPALSGLDVFTQVGFSDSALTSLAAYYAQRNVWLQDERLHHEGGVVNGAMLFPNERLKKTEFWGDWLRHQDIFHTAAAVVEKKHDRSVNVTVCRPESMGEYTDDELTLFRRLMPHLQAGFALHRRLYRLQALSQAATGALEQVPFGVVLLDHRGNSLFANQRAEAMAHGTGLMRLHEGGAPRCSQPADEALLRGLVAQATSTGSAEPSARTAAHPGGSLRLSALDGQQLQLLVAPLPSWSEPFGVRTAAAIFISNPAAGLGAMAPMLRSIYRMTPAESRLTEALVNGRTPQEYAEMRHISLHTVRSQLKAATAKAGVGRQSDLVRVVLTGLSVLGRAQEGG